MGDEEFKCDEKDTMKLIIIAPEFRSNFRRENSSSRMKMYKITSPEWMQRAGPTEKICII